MMVSPIQGLKFPVREIMAVGVGGKYFRVNENAVPRVPQLFFAAAVIVPPLNPEL